MSLKNGKKYKIAAIVPVYNEEKNVYGVLSTLSDCKQLDQIICVNDGSTDNSLQQINRVKNIKVINHPKNKGKPETIITGLLNTKADIIVFIDADLKGINNDIIIKLTQPLVDGDYDSVVGYYRNYAFDDFFKSVSGERSYFRKDLLSYLNKIRISKYVLELQLNYLFKDKRVKVFRFQEVKHDLKFEKQPFKTVLKLVYKEAADIVSQIIKAENPIDFVKNAYFARFYFKKSE